MVFDPYKRESARSQRVVDAHIKDVTANPFAEKKKRAKAATKRKAAKGRAAGKRR